MVTCIATEIFPPLVSCVFHAYILLGGQKGNEGQLFGKQDVWGFGTGQCTETGARAE